MSSSSTISSFLGTVWFRVRRSVLRCRVRRYRRMAICDEIRVGDDLVITHHRRDLKFETKVAEFNAKYKRMAPKGAVSAYTTLRKSSFGEKGPRHPFTLATIHFFDFKDILVVRRGSRKVVVDRTGGLTVFGNMKAALQEGGLEDLYRQTVLSVESAKSESKQTGRVTVKPQVKVVPEVKPTPEPKPTPDPDPESGPIILDPEAVAEEQKKFKGNVDKIGKAINNGTAEGPIEFEEHERALVEYLRGCEECRAAKQELQGQLTPYRKRLGTVLDAVNRKSCDITGEPLVVQEDGGGDYQMIVSYYNIIFNDGR